MITPTDWQLLATEQASTLPPEQVLPFLQDGSPRTAFVSGAYKACLETQRSVPENASVTTSQLGQYCLCYGRALADVINSREYQDLVDHGEHALPSLTPKIKTAGDLCEARMLPARQNTARNRDIVAATNDCLKSYFPEDTDFEAAVVRNKYCSCFAPGLVDLLTGLGAIKTLFSGPSKAMQQLKDRCSQGL
jgi:hypothetical protein